MSSVAFYLHGIPVEFQDGVVALPLRLPELCMELSRVYGSSQVDGYFQPSILALAPAPDLDGKHQETRIGVTTALRYVSPISASEIDRAISILQRERPWIPSVAP